MKKVIGIIRCKENLVNLEILHELLKLKNDIDITMLEIDIDDIEEASSLDLGLDIIVDVDIVLDEKEQDLCLAKKIRLINNLEDNDLLVVNADNTYTIKLSSSSEKPIIMTYGLNGKSSITISSLNFDDNRTKFNLCLQRMLTTVNGVDIEQFEYPIEMGLMTMDSLYTIIAFISTSLYFGVDIEDIAKTLFNVN